MKLTQKERKAVEMMRKLDSRQVDEHLALMRRQLAANRITTRVGKLRRLKVVDDKKIVRAFGTAPFWKQRNEK